jgi:hypothetical protein
MITRFASSCNEENLIRQKITLSSKYIQCILIVLVIVALVCGVTKHQLHLVPHLPFAFLLGCLVGYLLMYHGHGHYTHNDKYESKPPIS